MHKICIDKYSIVVSIYVQPNKAEGVNLKFKERLKRFGQIFSAHGLLYIFDLTFDNVLYPLAIIKFGIVVGGSLMTVIAGVLCFIFVISYERMGHDWLGVNVVEEIKKEGDGWVEKLDGKARASFLWKIIRIVLFIPSRIFRVVLWALKKGDVLAFFALSIFQDAFKTTIFLRHGRFDGLKRRDWIIFSLSIIVSNGYWVLRTVALIEIAKAALRGLGVLH